MDRKTKSAGHLSMLGALVMRLSFIDTSENSIHRYENGFGFGRLCVFTVILIQFHVAHAETARVHFLSLCVHLCVCGCNFQRGCALFHDKYNSNGFPIIVSQKRRAAILRLP